MATIALNARFYSHVPTGMPALRPGDGQAALRRSYLLCGPGVHCGARRSCLGAASLPIRSRGRLLWSPNNTGPTGVSSRSAPFTTSSIDRPDCLVRVSACTTAAAKLVHRVQHLIAVSDSRNAGSWRVGRCASKVTVVWKWRDAHLRHDLPTKSNACGARLESSSREYLLSVGSLEPRKNLRLCYSVASNRVGIARRIDLVVVELGERAGFF